LDRVRPAGVGLAGDRGLGATHRPTSRGGRPRGAPRARGSRLGGQPRRATEPPRVPAVMLVDTSAWIELLRATGHPAHVTLRYHLERRSPIATTERIIMELLAGTRTSGERARLLARLISLPPLPHRGLADVVPPAPPPRRPSEFDVDGTSLISVVKLGSRSARGTT